MVATNVSAAVSGAAPLHAAGSPSAVFLNGAHIFYRALDGSVREYFEDGGAFQQRSVPCTEKAASDPTTWLDSEGALAVSFVAVSGGIHVARLGQTGWTCQATRALS